MKTLIIIISTLLIVSCNPFAPALSVDDAKFAGVGDQRLLSGVFQNFRYAYQFKDTIAYGRLLDDEFTFIYRNYDAGVDYSWGRAQDMNTTAGLFNAAQSLDLLWNDVVAQFGDSLNVDVSRGFNLTIMFTPEDVIRLQGRVNLRLQRQNQESAWKIVRWRDESNY
mgnify:CR=1 FL=1